jgi:hypothetical protein
MKEGYKTFLNKPTTCAMRWVTDGTEVRGFREVRWSQKGRGKTSPPLFSERVGNVCRTPALETKGKNGDIPVSAKPDAGRH